MYLPPLQPPPLQPGDTVAVIATSGIVNQDRLRVGVWRLGALGLHVRVFPSCYQKAGPYLAGTDQQRVGDLHRAFADPQVKGIFTARGGYGAAELLPLVDVPLIRKNPKLFVGFSDVTALHLLMNQQVGLATLHGPMVVSCLGGETVDKNTMDSLRQAIFSPATSRKGPKVTGGNLSVITSLMGTPWEIGTHGKILFLEDVDEAPYKIDRMLLQLKLAGKLDDAAGFHLGDFSPENTDTIRYALERHIFPQKKPTVCGLKSGHGRENITLWLG